MPTRRPLAHDIPQWVETGAVFFITICAADRAARPFLSGDVPQRLLSSVAFLHERGEWFARLFLVMPDHVHALLSFPPSSAMAKRVAAWKSYTAKTLGVEWQDRFFDHRIRGDESLDEKAAYIRANPVRAGLTSTPEEWPYVFDGFAFSHAQRGSAGTPRPT